MAEPPVELTITSDCVNMDCEEESDNQLILEQVELLSNRKKKKWQNLMHFLVHRPPGQLDKDGKSSDNDNDDDRPGLVGLTLSSSTEESVDTHRLPLDDDDHKFMDDALSTATPLSLAETEVWHQENMDEMDALYDEIGSEFHTFDRLESEFVADLNELSQGLEQAFLELQAPPEHDMTAVDVEGLRQPPSPREKRAPPQPTKTRPVRTFSAFYREAVENQKQMQRGFRRFWEQLCEQWEQFWADLIHQLQGKGKEKNRMLTMGDEAVEGD